MFERAVRNKIRFDYKGLISVEDLWDLSQTELDRIFQPLKTQLDRAEQGSLLGDKPKALDDVKFKIDILRHIATTKKEEAEKRQKALERKQQKAKLLQVLERKEESKLESMTTEQIRQALDALDVETV